MGPLAQIEPNWTHPILKINVLEILKKLDKQKLEEYDRKIYTSSVIRFGFIVVSD